MHQKGHLKLYFWKKLKNSASKSTFWPEFTRNLEGWPGPTRPEKMGKEADPTRPDPRGHLNTRPDPRVKKFWPAAPLRICLSFLQHKKYSFYFRGAFFFSGWWMGWKQVSENCRTHSKQMQHSKFALRHRRETIIDPHQSQTHFGFTNLWSNMPWFWMVSF